MNSFAPLLITLLIQSFSALGWMAVPVLIPVELGPPPLSAAGLGLYVPRAYDGAVMGSLYAGRLVLSQSRPAGDIFRQ